jgi:hypothetical protein
MELDANRIDVNKLREAFARPERASAKKADEDAVRGAMPAVRGTVRVTSHAVLFGPYTFSSAKASVGLAPGEVNMTFTEAETCGLSVTGTLVFSRGEVRFAFHPAASQKRLEASIACLVGEDMRMTGVFDANAALRAQGKAEALLPSLEGRVELTAKDGRIYRYPLLAKIFSVLSVTEIFRAKAPELGGSGFPYHSITLKGDLRGGRLKLEQAFMDGPSLGLIAEGEVDVAGKKLDLVVLVAPFSTVDWIIRKIPLLGKVMGGTLVSIPVKVSGDLKDPDVVFLHPQAVGKRLVTIFENILKLPVEIISPILPKEKKK